MYYFKTHLETIYHPYIISLMINFWYELLSTYFENNGLNDVKVQTTSETYF